MSEMGCGGLLRRLMSCGVVVSLSHTDIEKGENYRSIPSLDTAGCWTVFFADADRGGGQRIEETVVPRNLRLSTLANSPQAIDGQWRESLSIF